MRVIDLLNKIANGEEVPRIIKINNIIYNFTLRSYPIHKLYEDENRQYYWDIQYEHLNDEVEIIEEKKIPEKIEYTFNLGFIDINDKDLVIKEVNKTINDLYKKYNEIIDYLEEENGN